jgi:hypothetical protein
MGGAPTSPHTLSIERNAGLSAAQVPTLTLKWAFAFPDARLAFGQPTLAVAACSSGATRA